MGGWVGWVGREEEGRFEWAAIIYEWVDGLDGLRVGWFGWVGGWVGRPVPIVKEEESGFVGLSFI